jgi:predicted ATPase
LKHYIEIENVGPIKKAKIDLSKYVVLIGPQASGKSIIAKLIAIFNQDFYLDNRSVHKLKNKISEWNLNTFFNTESKIKYVTSIKIINYSDSIFNIVINESKKKLSLNFIKNLHSSISEMSDLDIELFDSIQKKTNIDLGSIKQNKIDMEILINHYLKPSIYIPAERIIISLLSQSIYSIIQNKINLPQVLLDFAANYEKARNEIKEYNIKFLKANYHYKNGKEILEINKQETPVADAASGFQTLIPMLLVCEYFLKDNLSQTYIIEEPELNLFPTAQKDLIYHLINIINNSYSKEQNTTHDLVMTTHSPYVLASLNNLLLAGKIKEEQTEKFAKAKKIVKGDYYITKKDLNVYALKNGKAKYIINKETGLIAENELDEVSEEINYEFNVLKELYFEK